MAKIPYRQTVQEGQGFCLPSWIWHLYTNNKRSKCCIIGATRSHGPWLWPEVCTQLGCQCTRTLSKGEKTAQVFKHEAIKAQNHKIARLLENEIAGMQALSFTTCWSRTSLAQIRSISNLKSPLFDESTRNLSSLLDVFRGSLVW